jgi:DNA-binding response OmpR family regulator
MKSERDSKLLQMEARAHAQRSVSTASAPVERALRRPSVLCAQQDPAIQQFLVDALADYQVTVTATAEEALKRMHKAPFDAYVVDYWLSDWSGVGLCREIRKTDPHVAICFYATAAADGNRARALRAGASAFVEAPVEPEILSKRLRALIQQADLASVHARVEETRVIQEELERQAAAAAARADNAMKRAAKAIEQAAKVRAFKAYVEAGGARAHFERWWPQQFDSCWVAHDAPRPSAVNDEAKPG